MGIVFSRAWEDDRLDLAALGVGVGDRVLVVAAAGDSALAFVAAGADVIAVDRNPDQLRLVALKSAAGQVLSVDQLHRWFEIGVDPDAEDRYRKLVRPRLAFADAAYWDARIGVFERGLHEDAGVGRSFARLGRLARLLVPGLARALEAMPSPEAQQAYWRARVQPRLFGPPTHFLAAHTPLLARLAPNPHELARMRSSGWSRGLVRRIDGVVARHLVRDHPWWRPALTRRPTDPGRGAAWLDRDNVAALADGTGSLRLVQSDLADALDALEPGSIDAISVSNVPDWLDGDGQRRLANAVRRVLAPGGRVLVRRVVASRPESDPFMATGLWRDPRGDDLVAEERTALYETVALLRGD
jgi:S-adenosylmethionine:diacylglycerol 3-amino-3-carboxypropyl transferase